MSGGGGKVVRKLTPSNPFSGDRKNTVLPRGMGRTIKPQARDRSGAEFANPQPDPMKAHLEDMPSWTENMYGSEGYDKDKFGYDHQDFNVGSLEGYDVAQLGGAGYELGGYDPTEVEAMNFDPYRRNTLQDVSATSASDQASAEGALARSGGLSASDRMAMASQFNRNKIAGRSSALGKVDELQAQNIYQTGATNAASQTAADLYMADQNNAAATTNAAAQIAQNQYLSSAQNKARVDNSASRNAYRRDDSLRRYGEQKDFATGRRDDWNEKGKTL